MKMAEYMESHIGEEYDGTISSVMNFGLFVQLDNMIEGLVHISEIKGDYYTFDETTHTLRGEKKGKMYKLGQKVRVVVTNASKENSTIDFNLVEGNKNGNNKFEAGIVLTGTEIKSIRNGNANIKDSYAIIKNGEVFLLNMFISEYKEGNIFNHEETRTRKLLLHKNEIRKINDKIKIKGLTIVPLKVYFVRGKAKVEIGIARGKHTYDKKETIKQRDIDREMKKSLKERF